MVKVFTNSGIIPNGVRVISGKRAGQFQQYMSIGTHYETNMRLTCDILKELNDFDL